MVATIQTLVSKILFSFQSSLDLPLRIALLDILTFVGLFLAARDADRQLQIPAAIIH